MLYSWFHYALKYLVILIFLANLYQVEFTIPAYSWIMFSKDFLFEISIILIFSRVVVSLVTNFSFFSLFLIIVSVILIRLL